ncbi:MAG: radical SAM protein [Candidatus Fermentibacteraceae bacterium]|nr:radical SAM protein [Candidatus Fermentibacteraceae bacterium]
MSRKPAAEYYAERRRRLLDNETCNLEFSTKGIFEIILASPMEYGATMSSLRFQNTFRQLASWPETCCERAFYPEMDEYHWRSRYGYPSVTLESGKSIKQSDLLFFTPSSEDDYIRILEMMSLSGIQLKSAERVIKWPLIIAGGTTVTANPMPLAEFMDAFVIGETEPSIGPVLDTIKSLGAQGASKKKLLRRLATLPGMYIPSIHDIPGKVSSIMRQWAGSDGMGMTSYIHSPDCINRDITMLEISRGCPFNCKFCQPGYVSLPYRECKLEELESVIDELQDVKILALIGSSPRSHPDIRKIIKAAEKKGLEIVLCSNKYDDQIHSGELHDDLTEKFIVLSPETGNDFLRKVIGKKLKNKKLLDSMDKHLESAEKIKIYFMIGLPFETDADRSSIVDFVKEVRSRTDLPIEVYVNPFIPKPWTAFQWSPLANPTDLRDWIDILSGEFRKMKKVKAWFGDPREAHIRALLARGDHRVSRALEEKLSGVGWNTAFKNAGINIRWVLDEVDPEMSFEWSFLNMGFGHTRLAREYHASISMNQGRIKDLEKAAEKEELD